jgi:hypothetical protein
LAMGRTLQTKMTGASTYQDGLDRAQ